MVKSSYSVRLVLFYCVYTNSNDNYHLFKFFLIILFSIIFFFFLLQNRSQTHVIAKALSNFKPVIHSGDLQCILRRQVMDMFKSGEIKILIATDVLCRGIDGKNVVATINMALPSPPNSSVDKKLFHLRNGRCGRFGTKFTKKNYACILLIFICCYITYIGKPAVAFTFFSTSQDMDNIRSLNLRNSLIHSL